ncbi:CAP domain-containing protein [Streptomyces sp. NPDC007905]|uniref:CAP domain-containing protein n=1 Tax=Streptomyces sp. NPDC007905 TaxID=3364788 RepID=UPI0036EF6161
MCLINQERQRVGARELDGSDALLDAARKHVDASLAQKWWGSGDPHVNPQLPGGADAQIIERIRSAGYCANGRWSGYEIAYTGSGGGGTPNAALNWWLHISQGNHAKIIRDPSLTDFGVMAKGGSANKAEDARNGAGTYVVEFGSCQK